MTRFMPPTRLRFLPRALPPLLGLALCACGGGEDLRGTLNPTAPAQLQGVAATGAPVAGATVTAVNRQGRLASTTTGPDGRYTLTLPDGGPYLLRVTDAAGRTWYSYAPGSGMANLTPLTTLALLQAHDRRPLADLFASWPAQAPGDDRVLDAARRVNANLAALMLSQGVAPERTNVFTVGFQADGRGLDAVLDQLQVRITCSATACTETLWDADGRLLGGLNAAVAIDGFSLSWASDTGGGSVDLGLGACRAPRTGTFSLLVNAEFVALGIGRTQMPTLCIDGLSQKPDSEAAFCGDETVRAQLPLGLAAFSCRYDGSEGEIRARMLVPLPFEYTLRLRFVAR